MKVVDSPSVRTNDESCFTLRWRHKNKSKRIVAGFGGIVKGVF